MAPPLPLPSPLPPPLYLLSTPLLTPLLTLALNSHTQPSRSTLTLHTPLLPHLYRGILAGHDFTRAHKGVSDAVTQFAIEHELTLYLTQVQYEREDVQGNMIPPCCPSWYVWAPPTMIHHHPPSPTITHHHPPSPTKYPPPTRYFFKRNADGSIHATEEKAPGVVATVNALPMNPREN